MKNSARAVRAGWDKVHNESNMRVGYLQEVGIPGEKSYGIIVYLDNDLVRQLMILEDPLQMLKDPGKK